MVSEEKILEEAREIGEKWIKKLREVSESPDLNLDSEYKEICKGAEKDVDVYFEKHKEIDDYLRTKAGELVFTKMLLKVYQELKEQK